MPKTIRFIRPAATALSVSALALGVAACKVDSRPLLARGEPAYGADLIPAGYNPDALGLPYANPAPLYPDAGLYDGYALAERAYAYDQAAYRAPPDYGFRYGQTDPWAWNMPNNALRVAEPYDDAYRFYYYQPGQTRPYFVRDPYYGYAYGDNGALMAVFDAAGAMLPDNRLSSLAAIAGRYLARGSDLRDTYYSAPRYAVADPLWIERAPRLIAAEQPWITAAQAQPVWVDYRAATDARQLAAFEAERIRRARIAAQYENRIDWGRAQDLSKARREAVKRMIKAEHADAKSYAKARHEDDKLARRIARERAKDDRRIARADARSAFDAGVPASARVEDPARLDGHGKRDKVKHKDAPALARNDHAGPPRHDDGPDRKDHGKGRDKDHGRKGDDHGNKGHDRGEGHGKGKH